MIEKEIEKEMAEVEPFSVKQFFIDKSPLREIVREQNKRLGILPDPSATSERSQELTAQALRRSGLRPEDNIGSCSIVTARDGA